MHTSRKNIRSIVERLKKVTHLLTLQQKNNAKYSNEVSLHSAKIIGKNKDTELKHYIAS